MLQCNRALHLFMADLLSRNSRIEEDLIDQLFESSEKWLAQALPFLANFGNEATLEPIVVKFSQETLAEMIGTARSRVDFFTNKFSDFQFSVVFDVAARERLIMRPLRRSHFRLASLTIIAERRRPFEPTLSLFLFFYRRACVVEGVDRRAR